MGPSSAFRGVGPGWRPNPVGSPLATRAREPLRSSRVHPSSDLASWSLSLATALVAPPGGIGRDLPGLQRRSPHSQGTKPRGLTGIQEVGTGSPAARGLHPEGGAGSGSCRDRSQRGSSPRVRSSSGRKPPMANGSETTDEGADRVLRGLKLSAPGLQFGGRNRDRVRRCRDRDRARKRRDLRGPGGWEGDLRQALGWPVPRGAGDPRQVVGAPRLRSRSPRVA